MGRKRIASKISTPEINSYGSKNYHQRRCKKCCQIFHRLYWPLWMILLCLVITLTVLNVAISLHLINFVVDTNDDSGKMGSNVIYNNSFHDSQTTKASENLNMSGKGVICDSPTSIHFHSAFGRFDNSRKYLIHDNVLRGESWNLIGQERVCLATQTSVEHLFHLVELTRSWGGLVSASVYVPGEDAHIATLYLQLLTRCFDVLRQNLSIHFVYPATMPPRNATKMTNWSSNCHRWTLGLRELSTKYSREFVRWRSGMIFPQNHLRNVARKACRTPFVYLIDIDIVPRAGLAKDLNWFFRYPSNERYAFVIPTYEVNEMSVNLPANKSELIHLVKINQSQPFHKTVFIHNQFATNSTVWERLPEGNGITVAYPVTNFELFYEPFYVSRDDAPPHDERFVGYGFTRNTQVYEMHVAGYKFVVLNYAFAMHRGLKKKKKKDPWREKQNRHNSLLFKSFKKEIHVRYEFMKKT